MKIEHIAVMSNDIEKLKEFYCSYFGATAGNKYRNEQKGFESYFLSFSGESRIEIMQQGISDVQPAGRTHCGYSHIAIKCDSEQQVDSLTERIVAGGYLLQSPPRKTGDGYYESCILDPDGNRVEITC